MSSLFEFSAALNNDPFDKFWGTYLRKVGKEDARKAWAQRTKKVDPRDIQLCLEQQNKLWKGVDEQFIPYPATWLRRTDFVAELKPKETVQRYEYRRDILTRSEKPPDWEPLLADEFERMLAEAKGKNRL